METKTCAKCGEEKSVEEFHQLKHGKDGKHSWCKDCQNEYSRQWYKENKERLKIVRTQWDKANPKKRKEYRRRWGDKNARALKDNSLRYSFGIGITEYEQMVDQQNNECAICGQSERDADKKTGKVRALAVDHDHDTGQIRGLLCRRCNSGLGQFEDDISRLESALSYLRNLHQLQLVKDAAA